MQVVTLGQDSVSRHPTRLELAAGALLTGTVILHVVAMFPTYSSGPSGPASLVSQPYQAALYSVLAAAWALALAVGLTGPARMPLCAGLAAGVAATELGFRVSDVGDAIRFGSSQAGAGLWLMAAAWLVGAAGAVAAVASASERSGGAARGRGDVTLRPSEDSHVGPYGQAFEVTSEAAPDPAPEIDLEATTPMVTEGVGDPAPETTTGAGDRLSEVTTAALPSVDSTSALLPPDSPVGPVAFPVGEAAGPVAFPVGEAAGPVAFPVGEAAGPVAFPVGQAAGPVAFPPSETLPEKSIRWTIVLGVLGLATAVAFVPSWDHYVVTSTGRSFTSNVGYAFSGPWEEILGNVLVAVALAAVPIAASRWRNRAAGAAAVAGGLMVLASQLVSAVVQVDQAVPPSTLGLTPTQFRQLGVQAGLKLTGWFTLDALAAFALFAAVMVWATGRVVQENSPETLPRAPELLSEAMPFSS